LQRLRVGRANPSEPERTPSAAIAAFVIVAMFNSRGGATPHERPPLTSASVATVFRRPKISLQIRATEFTNPTALATREGDARLFVCSEEVGGAGPCPARRPASSLAREQERAR
jgi:hypothetical protein